MRKILASSAWLIACTLLGIAVLGYHPYAEDGGLYVAEIKHAIEPPLYPHNTPFVTGHLGLNLFTHFAAILVGTLGLPLDWVLLALHTASLATLLLGVWLIAARCFESRPAQMGATVLTALWLGIPIGGTSLYLADPYLTARSLAVALSVLALAAGIHRRWALAAAALALAILAHPLMGGYGAIETAALWSVTRVHPKRWLAALLASAIAVAALIRSLAPAESPDYLRVAITRYYWFLSQWQWFEWLGLLAPFAILSLIAARSPREAVRTIARSALVAATLSVTLALLFAHERAPIHAVARLQPLRILQMVYLIMTLLLGGLLAERILKASIPRWIATVAVLSAVMLFVARSTYPGSNQLELPWIRPTNPWTRAFLWIRANTPKDALFAIDNDYVHWTNEDAQGFRAIAERSVLPDTSKDGGIASIRPELVPVWSQGERAQANLTQATDTERQTKVAPLGATWIVLGREATTSFECPYQNERVEVCRLPKPNTPSPTPPATSPQSP